MLATKSANLYISANFRVQTTPPPSAKTGRPHEHKTGSQTTRRSVAGPVDGYTKNLRAVQEVRDPCSPP